MTAQRLKLPDRRPADTVYVWFGGERYHVSVGWYDDGRLGETFIHGAKVGSDADGLQADIGVLISRLLQFGDDPQALAASMARLGDSKTPASIVGAVADLLAEIQGQGAGG